AKPQTFMNRSGESIRALADWFDVPAMRVVIIHDDADFPFGEVRVKFGGGTAGHNGLKSIVAHLGTESFWRVRVGIGRPLNPQAPLDRYVLERWTPEQSADFPRIAQHARAEVAHIITSDKQKK
ncbi:MAG: aminoacyl-tRNA hydrolase, partial [Patescibacteria group bacterium]